MDEDYAIRIIKSDNGWICEWREEMISESPETVYQTKRMVFEEEESDLGELKAMKSMLFFIQEHFGVFWSKHNDYNIKPCIWDMKKDKEYDE
jgi:hypothetical protein